MGMRKDEILALNIKDIDFESNTININKQLIIHMENKKYNFIIGEPKTNNSYRKIYITNLVNKELKNFIDNINIFNIGQEKQYLFVNPITQKIYAPSTVNYRLKELLEKNKMKHIKFHDLRHLHATMLINSGVNIVSVSKRLRDTINTVTKIYLHSIEKIDKESVETLENFIEKVKAN